MKLWGFEGTGAGGFKGELVFLWRTESYPKNLPNTLLPAPILPAISSALKNLSKHPPASTYFSSYGFSTISLKSAIIEVKACYPDKRANKLDSGKEEFFLTGK